MNESNEPFWMVWNEQGRLPAVKHTLYQRAVAEAERLARQCPGQRFYVLQATEMRCVNDMVRVALREVAPF